MLAQNFKTADELRITEPQHNALRLTLNALERDELKHVRPSIRGDDGTPFTGHFNMDCWHAATECGTVACIGGTAEMLGRLPANSLRTAMSINRRLRDLFYPQGLCGWAEITSDQAAMALRSFLTTGNANWREACPMLLAESATQ